MPFNLENFKNQPPIAVIRDEDISGLSLFKKSVEKLFFSDVLIRNSNSERKVSNLIIEVSCNFSLWQGLTYLQSGIWARFPKSAKKSYRKSEFYKLVVQLQKQNDFPIEVEEFSIIFDDCNIVINQIYDNSIPEQLGAILSNISDHYTGLTKGGREVPYEIFIPVFEEDTNCCTDTETMVSNVSAHGQEASDYFNFWAVYFDNREDALLYALKKRTIINGELNMLNN